MSRDAGTSWLSQLRRTYRRAVSRTALEAVVLAGSRLLPIWLALLAVGMLIRPTPALAWTLAIAAWVAGVVVLVWAFRRILRRRSELLSFAAWLEEKANLSENELVNALELEQMPALDDPLARHLVGRVVNRAQETHKGLPLGSLLRQAKLPAPLAAALGSLAVGAFLFWLSPVSFNRSVTALSTPASVTPPYILIHVEPGNVSVERGESLYVRAVIDAPEKTEEAKLLVRGADGVWRTHDMSASKAGRAPATESGGPSRSVETFTYRLEDLQAGLTYLVSTKSQRSSEYQVEIREPLRALGYRKILDWPAYSRLSRQSEISSHGDLTALLGTKVTLQVTPTRPRAQGKLLWSSGREIPLGGDPEGHLEGRWTVTRADTYRVVLEDSLGARWISDPYLVTVLEDQPPVLRVLAPTGDMMMPPEMEIVLDVECVDDYGLGELALVYSRAWEQPKREQLGHWDGTREARVTHPWDLNSLGVLPGQGVTFYFEVSDNDDISGPKVTRSQVFTLRFPSMAEMYAQIEQDRTEDIQDLGEMLENQEELQKDLEEISRELKKETDLSWEKQQEVQKLVEQQKELGKQLDEVTQSMEQSLRNMEENALFTPDMIEKLQQIRDLVSEIQSEEFHEYLEAMQKAVENLDRNALQKAMEQFKFTQEEIRQGLDRTLELLQRLMAEEKLDRLMQEVERLAMEQKALNEQLEEGQKAPDSEELAEVDTETEREPGESEAEVEPGESEPPEGEIPAGEKQSEDSVLSEQDREADSELSDDQSQDGSQQEPRALSQEELDALRQEQERLAKEAEKLQEMFEQLKEMSRENLEQLAEMLEQMQQNQLQQAQQNMQGAQKSMKQGKQEESLRFGRQAQQNLQSMLSSLLQAQTMLQQGEAEEITRQLFALSNQIVNVSLSQERLMNREGKYPTDKLAVEEQNLLEGTRSSLDSLFALQRKTPVLGMEQARQMGEAVRKMENAVDYFEKGRRSPGVANAHESATALDDALRGLLEAQSSMCMNPSGNPSSSCQNQMQGLSNQQSRLNKQTQQMLGQAQGQRLSPNQSQQVMGLAARQEMIKKGLQDVSEQVGDQRDILGRLDDMVEEMEEIAREMRSRGIDERILRRQEKILSRLLTAQRSIRRQDQREERISRPGETLGDRPSPPPVPPRVTRREQILRGILRGGQDPIPSDYRQLVEEYWKALMSNP